MLLEAWSNEQKILHFDDNLLRFDWCEMLENATSKNGIVVKQFTISMEGCLILYGYHRIPESIEVKSKQDCNIGILSFQLNGQFRVDEKNYEPYRVFENEMHNTFFTNKRELVFTAPPVFENFRVVLSPEKFLELLAKFHGRFSVYAEKVNRGEYFNLFEKPMAITPKIKMVIREILAHRITDPILSKVYCETKVTELFGCQLEQWYSNQKPSETQQLSDSDKRKIQAAREILLHDIASEPPTTEALARQVGTNEYLLKKGFKLLYGNSVFNYLINHRVEKAIELMNDTTLSLDEIAARVGYADSAHFSRAFKRVKGIPPGQFRKR